jgi:hypothetical protein
MKEKTRKVVQHFLVAVGTRKYVRSSERRGRRFPLSLRQQGKGGLDGWTGIPTPVIHIRLLSCFFARRQVLIN